MPRVEDSHPPVSDDDLIELEVGKESEGLLLVNLPDRLLDHFLLEQGLPDDVEVPNDAFDDAVSLTQIQDSAIETIQKPRGPLDSNLIPRHSFFDRLDDPFGE